MKGGVARPIYFPFFALGLPPDQNKPLRTNKAPTLNFSDKCPFGLIFVVFFRSQRKNFAREEMRQKETNTYTLERDYHFVTISPLLATQTLRQASKFKTES